MKRALVYTGSGWDLYLSKPILKLTGFIPKEDKLLLTVEKDVLIVSKIKPDEEEIYKGRMIKSISKCGSGWSLYIPVDIIELLDINPETDLVNYQVDGQVLIIKKAD